MEQNSNMSQIVIDTINTIFEKMFSSIDFNLYSILDDLTFVNSSILNDKYFGKIFGSSASNGLLLIANSLLIGFILYFAVKYLFSNFTFSKVEHPAQFIFKLIIFGILMNNSYFIIGQFLDLSFSACEIVQSIGEDIFKTEISFSNLISSINTNIMNDDFNVFSIDGIIKGTTMISMINLVTTYALRYIVIKIFVLLTPFAFLSLSLENSSWFFKLWARNLFALLFIQFIVSIVFLLLFSLDYSSNNLLLKFVYVGGIYALIRVNSFVREFLTGTGISTHVETSMLSFKGR